MKLAGKVAMVTGAGRGIGRAIALKLSEEGAELVINDLEKSPAENVASKIEQSGKIAIPVAADISSGHEVSRLFGQAIERFGHLDILINNAGVRKDAFFHEMSEKEWDQVVNTVLKGSFNCCQA
ncbi:MAG: SDR family NAD(P)-dependent oxidoreductase, partial [Syntrophales bacterium]|nr:SDR family NAD(P)-dependent oxidoreductase [Syntrophales bacterium]